MALHCLFIAAGAGRVTKVTLASIPRVATKASSNCTSHRGYVWTCACMVGTRFQSIGREFSQQFSICMDSLRSHYEQLAVRLHRFRAPEKTVKGGRREERKTKETFEKSGNISPRCHLEHAAAAAAAATGRPAVRLLPTPNRKKMRPSILPPPSCCLTPQAAPPTTD